jgi:DNA polymerase III alpha subunit
MLKDELGDQNVIPISNHNTFQLRSLVKDIARFYDVPFEEANEATKTLDDDVRRKVLGPGDDKNLFQLKYDDAVKHSERFRTFIEKYPDVGEHIKVLFKQSKTIGKHAGGIVIGENLDEILPLIAVRGETQVPWPEGMHYKTLEATCGIPKIDALGLTTLRIIERAIGLIISRTAGRRITIDVDGEELIECFENDEIQLSDGTWARACSLTQDSDIMVPVHVRYA